LLNSAVGGRALVEKVASITPLILGAGDARRTVSQTRLLASAVGGQTLVGKHASITPLIHSLVMLVCLLLFLCLQTCL